MGHDSTRSKSASKQGMRMTRRGFLKTAGTGAACMAAAPCVFAGQRQGASETSDRILSQADDRIRRYRKGTVTLQFIGPDGQKLPSGLNLRIEQTQHKFLFGCNIFKLGRCRTAEHNAAYEKHFADLLNYATLPFYWWMYERQEGKPEDERTEEIIRWCNARNITMKGHPLAWNWGEPPWLTGTPEEAMQLQLKRIGRCVDRFKGNVDIWDVVNEATHHDRDQAKERAPRLTRAISRMGVGEYVRTAFRIARQANPQAMLLINDYRTDPAYADSVISQLVDDSKKPLYDVIGIQSHMHGRYWGATEAWEVCERYAKFARPLHFTETTVVSGPKQGSTWTTTAGGEQRQAELVTEFYTVLFSHPAVEAITWWDFTDQDAWQSAPAGLVRDDMTPKPAFEQLRDLIKRRWWTRMKGETDSKGEVAFHGFLGGYEVKAKWGSRQLKGEFRLDDSAARPTKVQLT